MGLNTCLENLEKEKLNDLASFIVSENYCHHTNGVMPANYYLEVADIYQEELMLYHEARIFVTRDYLGGIVGSIRVAKWDYQIKLPIKKIFGICPSELVDKNEDTPI